MSRKETAAHRKGEQIVKRAKFRITENPSDHINYGLAAYGYYKLEDYENSLKYYKLALELAPEIAIYYFRIANIYTLQENHDQANPLYKKYKLLVAADKLLFSRRRQDRDAIYE